MEVAASGEPAPIERVEEAVDKARVGPGRVIGEKSVDRLVGRGQPYQVVARSPDERSFFRLWRVLEAALGEP